MSHTKSTTHYSFPQFVASDTPAWLTDINQAFSSIDSEIYARQQTIASNTDAITGHTAQIQTINDKLTADEQDIANLTGRVSTAETNINNNTGLIATHTSQISSLANQLTNLNATNVSYDNESSGLTATTVQGAIDEVVAQQQPSSLTLLWTNDNLQTAFQPKKITLDLTNYSAVGVVFISETGTPIRMTNMFTLIKDIAYGEGSCVGGVLQYTKSRVIQSVTNTGVDFGNGYNATNSANATNNAAMIPAYIYGIK